MFEPMQRRFYFGDLVRNIAEEDGPLYIVMSYSVTVNYYPDMISRELYYEIIDADTGEDAYPACDDELEIVATADQADEYLASRRERRQEQEPATIKVDAVDGELIDFLLDKYNESMWANRQLRKIVPDIAKEFRKDAKAVLAELKELMSDE